MKKVYFYLIFDNLAGDCWKSKNFNSIEEVFESKELVGDETSLIMEDWIKE